MDLKWDYPSFDPNSIIQMNTYVIQGKSGLPVSFDIDFPNQDKAPVILFLHGFKGFKDWGAWPLLAKYLASKGFGVIRMNFSHNGTNPENPVDFVDLEAFGNNTFTNETQDVQDILNWLENKTELHTKLDLNQINVLGHSRGGAIAIITAIEDDRIKKIATLSGVGKLDRYTEQELAHWKKEGVVYMLNGRTNQNMPLYYSLAEDYLKNESRFNLDLIMEKLGQPYLVIHAEEDETVHLSEGEKLAKLGKNATLKVIKGANHSFGGGHPYLADKLPEDTLKAGNLTAEFFKK